MLYDVAQKIMPAGARLCNQLGNGSNGCVYEFKLDESDVINAYADGKRIIVTQGMIDFAKTNDNLAIVLGHEYAHNLMGHIKAKKQNIGIGNIFGSLERIDPRQSECTRRPRCPHSSNASQSI